jgi:hypothetical protein
MARWMKNAPAEVRVAERAFNAEPLQDLLVFHQRPLPAGALTASQVTEQWIAAATRQLAPSTRAERLLALRATLGFKPIVAAAVDGSRLPKQRIVLLDASDPVLERELARKGFRTAPIRFTPFDEAAAAKVRHFETYNRTAASQRVADVVSALREHPGAAIVAHGDRALAAMLASAIEPVSAAVLDVEGFDPSNDDDYVKRLFIPGIRRAGGLELVTANLTRRLLVHNTNGRFAAIADSGIGVEARRLGPREIAAALATRAAAR